MLTESLSQFFQQLGAEWVLWLLAALSLLSVLIMCERILFHRRNKTDADALTQRVVDAISQGGVNAAVAILRGMPGIVPTAMKAGLEVAHNGRSSFDEMVSATIDRERLRYDRFLSVLGTLANNAPFIGLFGTVIGILNAFGLLANALAGSSRSEMIMGSISEALVATAVGLAVAIPAVVAFNAFKNKTRTEAVTASTCARVIGVVAFSGGEPENATGSKHGERS